jgi:hypothetical protein
MEAYIHAVLDGGVAINDETRRARRDFAGRYFGPGDGRVSERVLASVSKLVDEMHR